MPMRWTSFEAKAALLLAAMLAVCIFTALQLEQIRKDISTWSSQAQTSTVRTGLLSQLIVAVNDPAVESSDGSVVSDGAGKLRLQIAALERTRATIDALLSSYQYEGATYARLVRHANAAADEVLNLRRFGHRLGVGPSTGPNGGFDDDAVMKLAVDLIAVERTRAAQAGSLIGPAIYDATKAWTIAFISVFLTALAFCVLTYRQIRSWRSRAAQPVAENYLRPGQVAADRETLIAGITSSIALSLKRSRTVGILAVGIDGLAELRGRGGEQAVDALIKDLTGRMRELFRRSDLIVRLNADTIMVMLHDITSRKDLLDCDARLNRALEAVLAPWRDGGRMSVTIGAAMYPIDGYSGDDLITAACTAMVETKQTSLINPSSAELAHRAA